MFSISGLGFMSYVQCPICILETKRYGTRAEAVAAWNHRPVEDALVEALKESTDALRYLMADTPQDNVQIEMDVNEKAIPALSHADAALKLAKEGRNG
jgi:hypothetical protein